MKCNAATVPDDLFMLRFEEHVAADWLIAKYTETEELWKQTRTIERGLWGAHTGWRAAGDFLRFSYSSSLVTHRGGGVPTTGHPKPALQIKHFNGLQKWNQTGNGAIQEHC